VFWGVVVGHCLGLGMEGGVMLVLLVLGLQ
jgi:hypothetical protein